MDFIGDPLVGKGVVERRFDLKCDDRLVPGIVWTPEGATGPRPLVLLGHGGSVHKRVPYILALARRVVRHHGWAAAAIDGPGHGDRAGEAITSGGAFFKAVAGAAETMTADWRATRAALRELDEVGDGPLGYWGLSMGTMLGIPFVAAEPDVRCAVLGLMGTFRPTDPWAVDAASITCPVLFLLQTDDELVAVDKGITLFQTLTSTDKRLHAHPGPHSNVPVEEVDASEAFFVRHLT